MTIKCLNSRIRTLFQKYFLFIWYLSIILSVIKISPIFIFYSMTEVTWFFRDFKVLYVDLNYMCSGIKYTRSDYWVISSHPPIWSGSYHRQIVKLFWPHFSALVFQLHAMTNSTGFVLTGEQFHSAWQESVICVHINHERIYWEHLSDTSDNPYMVLLTSELKYPWDVHSC